MPISVTHLNLTDVERALKDHDPRLRYLVSQMVEQHIALEQAVNELMAQQEKMIKALAYETAAMKILKRDLDKISRRYDLSSDVLSEDEPTP